MYEEAEAQQAERRRALRHTACATSVAEMVEQVLDILGKNCE